MLIDHDIAQFYQLLAEILWFPPDTLDFPLQVKLIYCSRYLRFPNQ